MIIRGLDGTVQSEGMGRSVNRTPFDQITWGYHESLHTAGTVTEGMNG